jgi:hypothetical protein
LAINRFGAVHSVAAGRPVQEPVERRALFGVEAGAHWSKPATRAAMGRAARLRPLLPTRPDRHLRRPRPAHSASHRHRRAKLWTSAALSARRAPWARRTASKIRRSRSVRSTGPPQGVRSYRGASSGTTTQPCSSGWPPAPASCSARSSNISSPKQARAYSASRLSLIVESGGRGHRSPRLPQIPA